MRSCSVFGAIQACKHLLVLILDKRWSSASFDDDELSFEVKALPASLEVLRASFNLVLDLNPPSMTPARLIVFESAATSNYGLPDLPAQETGNPYKSSHMVGG